MMIVIVDLVDDVDCVDVVALWREVMMCRLWRDVLFGGFVGNVVSWFNDLVGFVVLWFNDLVGFVAFGMKNGKYQ